MLSVRNNTKPPTNALIESKCGFTLRQQCSGTKETACYLVTLQLQNQLLLPMSKFVTNK